MNNYEITIRTKAGTKVFQACGRNSAEGFNHVKNWLKGMNVIKASFKKVPFVCLD